MELEKRKRTADSEAAGGTRRKTRKGERNVDAVKGAEPPGDEEVEEFFAILRRIHVAVKYFQKRDGGRELTVTHCSPSLKRDDLDGVNTSSEKMDRNGDTGLDLNSDPASDERDST